MAKVTWKELGPDDPIFKGGFVISSHRVRTKESDETQASKDDDVKEKSKKQY